MTNVGGVQLKLCATHCSPFSKETFPSLTVENDVSARLPNTTSASCNARYTLATNATVA